MAFSADGALLAAGATGGTVQIWDVATGEVRAILPGHISSILGVTFSPDGALLASASREGTVRIWDVDGAVLRWPIGARDRARWPEMIGCPGACACRESHPRL